MTLNCAVLYEALQPDEQLRDYVRPYAWLTKLYTLYRKKFYPDASKSIEATAEDAARTRELIREHIDVEALETEFPTYVLDEHFLTKKTEGQEARCQGAGHRGDVVGPSPRIRLDQDESFRPLSEKLQRLIDEAGGHAGRHCADQELEADRGGAHGRRSGQPPHCPATDAQGQGRNAAITDVLAEIAAATLAEADKHRSPAGGTAAQSTRILLAACCS